MFRAISRTFGHESFNRARQSHAFFVAIVLAAIVCCASPRLPAAEPPVDQSPATKADFTTATLRGRVVWMADAMARRHGVKSVAEASDRILALETKDGELLPILEDVRGRAFRVDPRLMKLDVELLVRQHRGSPMLQVIGVSAIEKDGKFEIDYWCEICAIAMYELKPCDCCQGETELRRRAVKLAPAGSKSN